MSENRKRPCLLRVTPEVDALVRAYAAKEGCTPNEAAEALINDASRLEAAKANIKELSRLHAEAVKGWAESKAALKKEREELTALRAAALSTLGIKEGSTESIIAALEDWSRTVDGLRKARKASPGAALPEDLDKRLRERAIARWQSKEDTIKHVLTVGLNRLDAVEGYAAKKKGGKK